MENLTTGIILEIFSRLPVDSVLRCARVCKTWRSLLFDNYYYFADIHNRRQLQLLVQPPPPADHSSLNDINGGAVVAAKIGLGLLTWIGLFQDGKKFTLRLHYGEFYDDINIDDQKQHQYSSYKEFLTRIDHFPPIMWCLRKTKVVGSCNGLICFSVPHDKIGIQDPVHICNPITQEYVDLPRLPDNICRDCNVIMSGFGYHPSTNQYKVVRISYFKSKVTALVQVYTLGDGRGWRNKEEINYGLLPLPGISINGSLHWMGNGKICAFDLGHTDELQIPLPFLFFFFFKI